MTCRNPKYLNCNNYVNISFNHVIKLLNIDNSVLRVTITLNKFTILLTIFKIFTYNMILTFRSYSRSIILQLVRFDGGNGGIVIFSSHVCDPPPSTDPRLCSAIVTLSFLDAFWGDCAWNVTT